MRTAEETIRSLQAKCEDHAFGMLCDKCTLKAIRMTKREALKAAAAKKLEPTNARTGVISAAGVLGLAVLNASPGISRHENSRRDPQQH